MKQIKLIFLFTLAAFSTFGQDDIRTKAFLQAQEMTDFYNKREIRKYVDYLLPGYYGNDNANKMNFSNMWERKLKRDTANFKLVELLKLSNSENQYQALFHVNFRNKENYIIGISDDDGNKWRFTMIFTEIMKFNQLLDIIPSLNYSLYQDIDRKYGKRIDYKIGEIIPPFNYTDINGNEISSKSLKGKVIVLNFWGIWCPPCIKEIPELNKLVEKYSNENLTFIAPAVSSPKEKLKNSFLPKHPFLYDIVIVDGDDYVISSFPTHVIINQKLEVIDIITGYSEENIHKLEKTIDETL